MCERAQMQLHAQERLLQQILGIYWQPNSILFHIQKQRVFQQGWIKLEVKKQNYNYFQFDQIRKGKRIEQTTGVNHLY